MMYVYVYRERKRKKERGREEEREFLKVRYFKSCSKMIIMFLKSIGENLTYLL